MDKKGKFDYWSGIEVLDNHNKFFLSVLQSLQEAMLHAAGKQKIGDVVRYLLEFSERPLELEEKHMLDYYYPVYAEHKLEHDELRKKVNEFSLKLDEKHALLSLEISVEKFMINWLMTHVARSDKLLGLFLQEKGHK